MPYEHDMHCHNSVCPSVKLLISDTVAEHIIRPSSRPIVSIILVFSHQTLLLIFDGDTLKHLIDVWLYRVKDIQDAHLVLYGTVTVNHK